MGRDVSRVSKWRVAALAIDSHLTGTCASWSQHLDTVLLFASSTQDVR